MNVLFSSSTPSPVPSATGHKSEAGPSLSRMAKALVLSFAAVQEGVSALSSHRIKLLSTSTPPALPLGAERELGLRAGTKGDFLVARASAEGLLGLYHTGGQVYSAEVEGSDVVERSVASCGPCEEGFGVAESNEGELAVTYITIPNGGYFLSHSILDASNEAVSHMKFTLNAQAPLGGLIPRREGSWYVWAPSGDVKVALLPTGPVGTVPTKSNNPSVTLAEYLSGDLLFLESDQTSVHAQILTPSLQVALSDMGSFAGREPKAVTLNSGKIVVASRSLSGDLEVRFISGSSIEDPVQVAAGVTRVDDMVLSPNGKWVLVLYGKQDGDGKGCFGLILNEKGEALEGEFQVNQAITGDQQKASAKFFEGDDERFVVSFLEGEEVVKSNTFSIVNRGPSFSDTSPVLVGAVGESIEYTLSAHDPDRDSVIFRLVDAPEGTSLDQGVLTVLPLAGTSQIIVEADDQRGEDNSITSIIIEVSGTVPGSVNVVQEFSRAISPAGVELSYQLPEFFVGDDLSYEVTNLDDSPLPTWVAIEGETLRISPSAEETANLALRVRAVTPDGVTAQRSLFVDVLEPAAFAPTIDRAVTRIDATEGEELRYVFPADLFKALGGGNLTMAASIEEGEWLRFEEGVLFGTPGEGDLAGATITLWAENSFGQSPLMVIPVTVTGTSGVVGSVHAVRGFTRALLPAGERLTYNLTEYFFGEELSYGVTRLGSDPLPTWVGVYNETLQIAPSIGDVANLTLEVEARSTGGAYMQQPLVVDVLPREAFAPKPYNLPTHLNGGVWKEFAYPLRSDLFTTIDGRGYSVVVDITEGKDWLRLEGNTLQGKPGCGDTSGGSVTILAYNEEGFSEETVVPITVTGMPCWQIVLTSLGSALTIVSAALAARKLHKWRKKRQQERSGSPSATEMA